MTPVIKCSILVLLVVSCFTTTSLTKSSKTKLDDILSSSSSNIRPGMLNNDVYASRDPRLRIDSNDSDAVNFNEIHQSEGSGHEEDANAALKNRSKKDVIVMITFFSTIFLLYNDNLIR